MDFMKNIEVFNSEELSMLELMFELCWGMNWVKLDDGKKKKEEIRLGIKLKDSLFLDNWESYL